MNPVRSVRNQYRGVNAHLHSLLQNESGWEGFHTLHIGHLATSLQAKLRTMGYVAEAEESLQIRRGEYGQADILIYDADPNREQLPSTQILPSVKERTLPLPDLIRVDPEAFKPYWAVSIYEQSEHGEPVTWIELLSPSNKPRGGHFAEYDDKRRKLLESGIVFVEIDYLHQSPRTLEGLPSYLPRRRSPVDADASAYLIAVIDPRPALLSGEGRIAEFSIDDPLPTMTIPLSGDDKVSFDFGVPYRKTFEEMFYGDRIDYTALPLRFDTYQEIDQARILSRMLHVMERAARGESLETEPSPLDGLPYDAALERWRALTGQQAQPGGV
jgi:hypothetical protein